MKISPIKLVSYNLNKTNSKSKNIFAPIMKNDIMPDYRFFQSFLGGYTTNLSQTYKNLVPVQYPSLDILNSVETELRQNPNSDKTLYDIHFEKYQGVLDCFDLSDLIEKYPEFKDVQPIDYVETQKGSFLDEVKNGQYEIFNNGEDLTLQLIKLYWGQGFSLSDLSKYLEKNTKDSKQINFHYTLKKLNIPLMTQKYAAVLKLSNKEYNEKFTTEMSIKLKEAKEARQQLSEGEPVVIPRGNLSQAHKEHISQGLKKYFKEHPEKIISMSERQKRFYEEHPEKKEELSVVMDYAWNRTQEGKSVARGLSRFLKKQYNLNVKETEISKKVETVNKSAMDLFWNKNSWAKAQFSQAVTKGWEYIDSFEIKNKETKITKLLPGKLSNKIELWAKKQGYDIKEGTIGSLYLYTDESPFSNEEEKRVQDITSNYFEKFPHDADCQATVLQFSILSILNDLEKGVNLPKSLKSKQAETRLLKDFLIEKCEQNKIYKTQMYKGKMQRLPIDGVNSTAINKTYIDFMSFVYYLHLDNTVPYFEQKLDEAYSILEDGSKLDIAKMFNFIGCPILN